MADLIESSPEATAWMAEALIANAGGAVFGRLAKSVIWSNDTDADGNLLVPLDPRQLAAEINADHFPLLLGHDPGRPLGKVIAAKVFENQTGNVFVAAVLGFYEGAPKLSFGELGMDPLADAPSPDTLPALPTDFRFQLAVDPREIDPSLVNEVTRDAPFPIDFRGRSNNAADTSQTFLGISVLFLALVWNPFVTTFANEASKDVYVAVRKWLRKLSSHMAKCSNPVVELQSFHGDCHISFMLRGHDVARHYKAHDALDGAAARAAQLIARMRAASLAPVRLVYEFHATDDLWYPSYAELSDGRLVSDVATLIAVEKLPPGLSLGIALPNLPEPRDE
ncbi:hypothetical protein [Sphingomonas mali]|uniref:hypothetical protein n=1 Tax=Sphingomonas mali TaxID=40682 RepID=UPI00083621CB|nr:hypothetical protein [Sphingomonas mali]